MSVFDGLIRVDEAGNIYYNQWIEWDHLMVPNKPELLRNIMRNILAFFGHCKSCTSLDGCYLLDDNKPKQPLHENCDCQKHEISFSQVSKKALAECPIIKFTNYIFKNENKKNIFESWGFTINDSEFLKQTLEKQAKENYIAGNYVLKNLDQFGQRLAIPINIYGHKFYSGWLLCPEGKIRNATPHGGWIK